MAQESSFRWITVDQAVENVLMRYPTTALIFLQYGRMHVNYSDPAFHLFPTYPKMTVGEYISSNRLNRESILRLLNAAAESEEYGKQFLAAKKK
ncbi:MAG TPA: hypothetical protein VGB25_09155 [Candidatus Binatia bacterium]